MFIAVITLSLFIVFSLDYILDEKKQWYLLAVICDTIVFAPLFSFIYWVFSIHDDLSWAEPIPQTTAFAILAALAFSPVAFKIKTFSLSELVWYFSFFFIIFLITSLFWAAIF